MPPPGAIKKLERQQTEFTAELTAAIQKARIVIAGKIRNASDNPKYSASKLLREKLFGEIHGVYDRLGAELDAWGKDMVAGVATEAVARSSWCQRVPRRARHRPCGPV